MDIQLFFCRRAGFGASARGQQLTVSKQRYWGDRATTLRVFESWRARLRPGALKNNLTAQLKLHYGFLHVTANAFHGPFT